MWHATTCRHGKTARAVGQKSARGVPTWYGRRHPSPTSRPAGARFVARTAVTTIVASKPGLGGAHPPPSHAWLSSPCAPDHATAADPASKNSSGAI